MDIEPGEAGGRAAHRELKEAAPASPPSPRARGHPGLALRSGEKLTGALLPRARSCPPTWGGRAPSPRGTCRSGSGLGSEAQALAPAATGQGFQRVTRAHSALLQGCWKRLEITTHTHTHTHTHGPGRDRETHTHTHTQTHGPGRDGACKGRLLITLSLPQASPNVATLQRRGRSVVNSNAKHPLLQKDQRPTVLSPPSAGD